MSYRDDIIKHLSDYRVTRLGFLDKGTWTRNGKIYHFDHILPKDNIKLNILQDYRDSFYSSYLSKIRYHQYFHHLNSSQAMCINFFFPLFIEEKLDIVLKAVGFFNELVDYKTVCFEKISDLEKNGRHTNFDFYLQTKNGKKFYFEIKYTEREFGKPKKDDKHKRKYRTNYADKCDNLNLNYCNVDSFLDNYQLMRNLIHVSNESYVVFLYPIDNIKVCKQVKFAKTDLIKAEIQQNIINLTWEQLLGYVNTNIVDSKRLIKQMNDFKDKYKIKPSM